MARRGCRWSAAPKLPLLKGSYRIDVFLLSEDGVLVYESVQQAALLDIRQRGLEQGVVSLSHAWQGVARKDALSADAVPAN